MTFFSLPALPSFLFLPVLVSHFFSFSNLLVIGFQKYSKMSFLLSRASWTWVENRWSRRPLVCNVRSSGMLETQDHLETHWSQRKCGSGCRLRTITVLCHCSPIKVPSFWLPTLWKTGEWLALFLESNGKIQVWDQPAALTDATTSTGSEARTEEENSHPASFRTYDSWFMD